MSYLTPRAGTILSRIFLTLLACATLGAQQDPAGSHREKAPRHPLRIPRPLRPLNHKTRNTSTWASLILRFLNRRYFLLEPQPIRTRLARDHKIIHRRNPRSELVFSPIPFSNQTLTWGIIPVAQYLFPASKGDSTSPRTVPCPPNAVPAPNRPKSGNVRPSF